MMRFRSLGSGSTGNATLVEASDGTTTSRLLVDCGLGIRQLERQLAASGLATTDLDAVFITHEHADHIGCVQRLAQRDGIRVWMSHGTRLGMGALPPNDGWIHEARNDETITVGAIEVRPFTVPHDAREPLQLVCGDGNVSLGILTDLGHITPHVVAHLQACTALLLECNHDPDLLARSAYPYFLQKRISGPLGHLANAQSAELLAAIAHGGLRHVVAAHLSQQNNRPELARRALAGALSAADDDVLVAEPVAGTGWLQI